MVLLGFTTLNNNVIIMTHFFGVVNPSLLLLFIGGVSFLFIGWIPILPKMPKNHIGIPHFPLVFGYLSVTPKSYVSIGVISMYILRYFIPLLKFK